MEETKRALLVIAGGRPIPNILTLFQVQPNIVIYIKSNEGWEAHEETFVSIAMSLPEVEHVSAIEHVNAYSLEAGKAACEQALQQFPHAQWTVDISSGPKTIGIAAYNFAKQRGIPCLYANTFYEKLVDLQTDTQLDATNLFHLDVATYMKIYHREAQHSGKSSSHYRRTVENWENVARELAESPYTAEFTRQMQDKKAGTTVQFTSTNLAVSPLVKRLEKTYHLITTTISQGTMACAFTTPEAASFLGTGDWLELYAWHEARRSGIADDCHWGLIIPDGKANNELDLVLTYKAQLIIGECKTGTNAFSRKHLDTLDSIAHLLGGHYVTKLLITDQPQHSTTFAEQAAKRRIRVVTKEELPQLKELLKQEAEKPTYSRI